MFQDYYKKYVERGRRKREELERIAKRKFLMELQEPGSSVPKRTRPPVRLAPRVPRQFDGGGFDD